jgi:O-antigen/teichoic acid export membrane protein
LLTSIGLNITSHTRYYPVSTAVGAAVNVTLNVVLIPGYGMLGAAWANGAAYAIQSAIAFRFSQRFYPIPYEHGRIARAVGAALLGYGVARMLPAMPPLPGVLARGTAVLGIVVAMLWFAGFFNAAELQWLNALWKLPGRRAPVTTTPDSTEMAGEVVSVDVPDALIPPRSKDEP